MNKHWPLVLLILTTAVFFIVGPQNMMWAARLAQSLGYSILVFCGVYVTLIFLQSITGQDYDLFVTK